SLTMGNVAEDLSLFMGAVIDERAFAKHRAAIERARGVDSITILTGGELDDSQGYFVRPTILESSDPEDDIFTKEYFGPILGVHVYDDGAYDTVLHQLEGVSEYGLTGAVIAEDRAAIAAATEALRFAAGNFYVNDKPTGSIVGQQPFGGARQSGTNDKAGSVLNLTRWTSARSIKETFVPPTDYRYPHMGTCQPGPGGRRPARAPVRGGAAARPSRARTVAESARKPDDKLAPPIRRGGPVRRTAPPRSTDRAWERDVDAEPSGAVEHRSHSGRRRAGHPGRLRRGVPEDHRAPPGPPRAHPRPHRIGDHLRDPGVQRRRPHRRPPPGVLRRPHRGVREPPRRPARARPGPDRRPRGRRGARPRPRGRPVGPDRIPPAERGAEGDRAGPGGPPRPGLRRLRERRLQQGRPAGARPHPRGRAARRPLPRVRHRLHRRLAPRRPGRPHRGVSDHR